MPRILLSEELLSYWQDRAKSAEAELAALRGRRCDGCTWWGAPAETEYADCTYPENDDSKIIAAGWVQTAASHYCAAWVAPRCH